MSGWTSGADPATAAWSYAEHLHWPIAQGTWLTPGGGCSCGEPACPRPGGHPLSVAWWLEATSNPKLLRKLWARRPEAGVLVPTGHAFDAIDMPVAAGREALHRLREMGYRMGPVTVVDDRMMIFVEVAARHPVEFADAPWRYGAVDVHLAAEGSYVALPPSARVRWAIAPTSPPAALPRTDEIIGTIVAVCLQFQRQDARPAMFHPIGAP